MRSRLENVVFTSRIAAKQQTAGVKFTHRPKNRHFRLASRLLAPIHVKFGTTKGHLVPLRRAKFHANPSTWVRTPPQNGKISR